MDESFRKMSEEFKVSYDKSFWEDAKVKLENDSLDSAFREAAAGFMPLAGGVDFPSESLGDTFMDEAFRDAAQQMTVSYDSAYWEQMQAAEADLQMDESFHAASKEIKASYNPAYWGAADIALQNEGLHYEYKSQFWDEARDLLDKADRRSFFTRWGGVAAVLLLLSLFGLQGDMAGDYVQNQRSGHGSGLLASKEIAAESTPAEVEVENELALNAASSNTNWQTPAESDVFAEEITQEEVVEVSSTSYLPNQSAEVVEEPEEIITVIQEEVVPQEEVEETPIEPLEVAPIFMSPNPLNAQPELANNETVNWENSNVNQMAYQLHPVAIENRLDGRQLNPLKVDLSQQRPLRIYSIAAVGGVGFGNSYGETKFLPTRRANAGLSLTADGFGKSGKWGFGINLMADYSEYDELKMHESDTYYHENGGWEVYFRDVRVLSQVRGAINLSTTYNLARNHKLKAGIGANRLMLLQTNLSYKNVGDDQITVVNNNRGEKRGMLEYDFGFNLGYEYRLNHKFRLELNAHYGLLDRSDNAWFNVNPTYDNEMSVTVGLRYNLWTTTK